MPVLLLNQSVQQQWLSDKPLQELLGMLQTPPNDILTYYPVSPAMNKVSFDEPSIHYPVPSNQIFSSE
jgi:putative SOS response-associated peptidase YedK